ncbi:GDP-L-fucose synthase family protein [Algisphaera agarilytica]|uniref:GDP-L-fucose synthase n=1 Tax=Algisphaera agarilytica TaxID=1385975 RepID=A0A7X0H997_9BACT|nr:GDP-L-fucose synthase [Algisphaera agarilytica]MBB6431458.1 GDP-L-fucose synthase [Algisphaera agarilytica]
MIQLKDHRIVVTGGAGFLGRFVVEALKSRGVTDEQIFIPRRKDYDLTQEADVVRLYDDANPDVVIHLAAEVGGIGANQMHPGRFFFANAAMGMHLIEHGRRRGIKKFLQTGTVCAYPKFAPVPFNEQDIWNGFPEETNAPYGVAKKALFVMLDGYKREYGLDSSVVVPVNLYGPHDNFDLETSHVIPALIRKCVEARDNGDANITCWGTGSASREFLFAEDAAEGIVVATESMDDPTPINLGTGNEIKIKDLVELIARLSKFEGDIVWDSTKPDGQPRRCLDTSKAENLMGWKAQVGFEEGLARTIEWFEQHRHEVREVVYG